jgi:hypothetical protein
MTEQIDIDWKQTRLLVAVSIYGDRRFELAPEAAA